jgi:hypothetical protein
MLPEEGQILTGQQFGEPVPSRPSRERQPRAGAAASSCSILPSRIGSPTIRRWQGWFTTYGSRLTRRAFFPEIREETCAGV